MDNVKDLLLSLFDFQMLNEVISQAVKYNNRSFQCRQDQSSLTPSRVQMILHSKPKPIHVAVIDGRLLSSWYINHKTIPLEVTFEGLVVILFSMSSKSHQIVLFLVFHGKNSITHP